MSIDKPGLDEGRLDHAKSGLVVVDKPTGLTSHDVVARVRRLVGTRKVGHAGTLDPMATGVLVLGVNRATRLLGHLLLTDKVYDATIRLGSSTTTDDAEGEVVTTASTDGLTEEAVLTALGAFVGTIDQVPSSVSAIKVGGRRAHERVRAGEEFELESRSIRVDSIEVHEFREAEDGIDVDVSVRCSSGTYIRSIARDLGERLQTGGHLTSLRRTAVGPFALDAARTLEQLVDPVVPPVGDPVDPDEAVPASAAAPRVPSGGPVVPHAVDASPSGHVVKSSSRWKPRPLAACASARATARPFAWRAAPR